MPTGPDPIELIGILLGLVCFVLFAGGFVFWFGFVLRRSWKQQGRVDESLDRAAVQAARHEAMIADTEELQKRTAAILARDEERVRRQEALLSRYEALADRLERLLRNLDSKPGERGVSTPWRPRQGVDTPRSPAMTGR
jgi:hypothetical protein